MINFTAQRLATDGQSIISRWTDPAGQMLCYVLEPGLSRWPHPGIMAGRYPLRLRTWGEKHERYLRKYGAVFHKGMIEICDVPGRAAIEFHIGNTIADTLGCSCCGENQVSPQHSSSGHWEVVRSGAAYEKVYPILRDAILAGPALLDLRAIGEAMA